MTFDTARWQARLDELRAEHHVPGASLAVLVDGEIHELASGVLHRGTGVEVTTDSVFQVGSITKIHTATLIMRLADEGKLDLDAPVVDVLPEFAVADPEATKRITTRQLLSHTSGMSGDFHAETGRGDDCLARFVEACVNIAQDVPPGTVASYSTSGYSVLGRIIEVLTGKTYDEALREMLIVPLGLEHTVTLPEEALRFRAAMSHLGPSGAYPEPAPSWNPLQRSHTPGGAYLCASAADIVRLGKLHLDGGVAPDGTRLLSEQTVASMQRREVEVPDKWTVSSDAWGLGWTLYDWTGVFGYGHDGATVGQHGYLRIAPEAGVVIALLCNGGDNPWTHSRGVYAALFRDLLSELAGARMPVEFAPATEPIEVDLARFVGTYRREGVAITVSERNGKPYLVYDFVDGMAGLAPSLKMELEPVAENVFAGRNSPTEAYMPVVFGTLPDGTGCCYIGLRAAPKIA
ncbi:serine hydrolase domain-containing protein [Amycolatopsis sp. NPDC059027]|uniref:serine hydrolase domain-containing protein n=1 Tax=Amycolatopsis sp. NPDC059027 TaxID=3346709 RepID=UPI00366AE8E3